MRLGATLLRGGCVPQARLNVDRQEPAAIRHLCASLHLLRSQHRPRRGDEERVSAIGSPLQSACSHMATAASATRQARTDGGEPLRKQHTCSASFGTAWSDPVGCPFSLAPTKNKSASTRRKVCCGHRRVARPDPHHARTNAEGLRRRRQRQRALTQPALTCRRGGPSEDVMSVALAGRWRECIVGAFWRESLSRRGARSVRPWCEARLHLTLAGDLSRRKAVFGGAGLPFCIHATASFSNQQFVE